MIGFEGIVFPTALLSILDPEVTSHLTFDGRFLGAIAGDSRTVILLLIAFSVVLGMKNIGQQIEARDSVKWIYPLAGGVMFSLSTMSFNETSEFLYFNF